MTFSSEMGNVHKVRSSDTLEICRLKIDHTFCSGRSTLPVGLQIIIKMVQYSIYRPWHNLHHQALWAIQHSGACKLIFLFNVFLIFFNTVLVFFKYF